jgi:hypothetical protein
MTFNPDEAHTIPDEIHDQVNKAELKQKPPVFRVPVFP